MVTRVVTWLGPRRVAGLILAAWLLLLAMLLALLLPGSARAGDYAAPLGGAGAVFVLVGLLGVAVFVGLPLYFLPAIFATFRKHPNAVAITALDLLAGWTLVGWVAALVWSLTGPLPKED